MAFTISLRLPASGPPWLPDFARSIEDWLRRVLARTSSISSAAITASTALTGDDATVLVNAAAGAVTLALPAAASVTGQIYTAKKVDSSGNAVVLDPSGAETIDGAATKSITTQWNTLTIQSNGTAWFVI